MNIKINMTALQTALHNLLSCRCPVTAEAEKALFGYYREHKDLAYLDMGELLEVAEINPEPTPLHGLAEFCGYQHDNPLEYAIEQNDVLRFLGSGFHYKTVEQGLDPALITNPASHLICHLMRPCRVSQKQDAIEAYSNLAGHDMHFCNLVHPPEVDLEACEYYGVHLGTVITGLDPEQAEILERHQGLISGIENLAREVGTVDFKEYQRYGDYAASVMIRVNRNYPA